MLLSDSDIKSHIESGEIELSNFSPEMIQPSSIDVRLDKYFRVFDNHKFEVIDPAIRQDGLTHEIEIETNECFVLHPGEFVLASTYEYVRLGNSVAARLEGKSSLGRLGLLTHSTAGFIDPGFKGHITLELSNMATLPIRLYPGMKIGQLCFMTMSDFVEKPYGEGAEGSRYQNQRGPTESRSYINFYKKNI
ncbi:MAG: dCTP deaminase [Bifidobacteriaceae bacterium]|jgi:dCTP deaminase|nr:dCTP deaminase [Bifidobacteriaceae bacterium]